MQTYNIYGIIEIERGILLIVYHIEKNIISLDISCYEISYMNFNIIFLYI